MSQYTPVPCPNCQRTLRVRKEYSDKVIACKYCEHAFHPKVPIPCPNCGETLNVRIGYLGQRITCKHCDVTFRAPRAEDAEAEAHADTDPALAAALQVARLETAALEEQAEKLRGELATRSAEQATALDQVRRATEETTGLRARVHELQDQLDQARIDLAQASGLRQELDAARSNSQLLNARTDELMERTREVEELREQLGAVQAEFQQARADLQAAVDRSRGDAETAGAALTALQGEMATLATHHEQHLSCLTAELGVLQTDREQVAAARDQALQSTEEIRLRVAEVEQSLQQAIQGHAATLEEAQARWETERQALHAQWEARHGTAVQEHEGRLSAAQALVEEERRRWTEHEAEARNEIENARAEIARVREEWRVRHEETVAEHERRLAEEQARTETTMRGWEERHAEAERRLLEQRSLLQGQIDQLSAEAEALRGERDRHRENHTAAQEEAAAGVARLQQAEAEAKGQAQASADRQQATEAAREALRGQLDALAKELETERGLRHTETDGLRLEIETLRRANHQIQAEHEAATADRQRVETELATAQQRLLEAQERDRQGIAEQHQQADALRAERDHLTTGVAEREAALVGLAEQLSVASARAEQHEQELAALHRELDVARADATAAIERAAHASEEQARLAAGHVEWQDQLDAVRRQHDEARAALHAELASLRAERDEIAAVRALTEHRGEASAAEASQLRQELDAVRRALAEHQQASESANHRAAAEVTEEQERLRHEHSIVQQQLEQLRQERERERAGLRTQLEAAQQQAAGLVRERDDALAGWDVAARFLRETEDRTRTEMAGLATALEQVQRDHAAQLQRASEAGQRIAELQAERDAQNQRLTALAHELEAARAAPAEASPPQLNSEQAALLAEVERLRGALALQAQAEAARETLAREVDGLRAELAAEKQRAAGTEQLVEVAQLAERFAHERATLAAEMDKLRQEVEHARSERERAAAGAPPTYAEIGRRHDELAAKIEAIRTEVARLHEAVLAGRDRAEPKSSVLGRLLSRTPEPRLPAPDPVGLDRRLAGLRVEVAVERERALRNVAEMAKADLERQFAEALARLRAAEERLAHLQPGAGVIPLPYGGTIMAPPNDRAFIDPPRAARPSVAARPRRPGE